MAGWRGTLTFFKGRKRVLVGEGARRLNRKRTALTVEKRFLPPGNRNSLGESLEKRLCASQKNKKKKRKNAPLSQKKRAGRGRENELVEPGKGVENFRGGGL